MGVLLSPTPFVHPTLRLCLQVFVTGPSAGVSHDFGRDVNRKAGFVKPKFMPKYERKLSSMFNTLLHWFLMARKIFINRYLRVLMGANPMCFHLSILRVSSVKTQLIYSQLNWRHVSTQNHHHRCIVYHNFDFNPYPANVENMVSS